MPIENQEGESELQEDSSKVNSENSELAPKPKFNCLILSLTEKMSCVRRFTQANRIILLNIKYSRIFPNNYIQFLINGIHEKH